MRQDVKKLNEKKLMYVNVISMISFFANTKSVDEFVIKLIKIYYEKTNSAFTTICTLFECIFPKEKRSIRERIVVSVGTQGGREY